MGWLFSLEEIAKEDLPCLSFLKLITSDYKLQKSQSFDKFTNMKNIHILCLLVLATLLFITASNRQTREEGSQEPLLGGWEEIR